MDKLAGSKPPPLAPCFFRGESKTTTVEVLLRGGFMTADFWKWLLGVVSSTGLIGVIAFLMRDTVAKFFSKAVEHRFEKKLGV